MRIGSDKDIALLMGLSLNRAQIRFQQGLPMPPAIRIPGLRSRRFDLDSAEKWLRDHCDHVTVGPYIEPRVPVIQKRKRGRPRKTKKHSQIENKKREGKNDQGQRQVDLLEIDGEAI